MTEEKDTQSSLQVNPNENQEGAPVCKKCGSILIEENGEMVCPDCDGEIDFFGEEEEELDNS